MATTMIIIMIIVIQNHFLAYYACNNFSAYFRYDLVTLVKSSILKLGILAMTLTRYFGISVTTLFTSTNLCNLAQVPNLQTYCRSDILLFIKNIFYMLGKFSLRSLSCFILLLVRMSEVSRSRYEKLPSFLIQLSLRSMHSKKFKVAPIFSMAVILYPLRSSCRSLRGLVN